ncbi:MAG: sulfatase [Planctomycetes bacterium]|nr:sulfatase [Planctomycetota bacterium]
MRASQIIASLLLVATLGAPSLAQEDRRPNFLFIFSDDHAPHAIGAYGTRYSAINPTPNIDQLANQGMTFKASFCTNSICGPSRAVILTGKHSHYNGFMANGDRFDGDQQTFPKLLRAAGYQTALVGKWHLQSDPQGFDYWDVLPGQGDYYNPELINANGRRMIEGYCTDIVTDLAIDWIENRRDQSKPFLLMAQHKGPHRNWMPPLRHLDWLDGITLPEPATLFDDYADNASPASWQEMEIDRHMALVFDLFLNPPPDFDPKKERGTDKSGFNNMNRMTKSQRMAWDAAYADENAAFYESPLEGKNLVRWKYQRYMKNYLRTSRAVDDSVGRLVDYLDEAGISDNTIVIYSSDQGFYLGDHGWYDKRWMYEESLAMPLVVRWPGKVGLGITNGDLVQNLDYAPTFLDLAGVDIPVDMQGRSLAPLLMGDPKVGWREEIYYHYYGYPAVHQVARHYGIRTERYKLIHYYQFGEWELFDLQEDPDEVSNVYADPVYREVAFNLAERLGALRAHYGDTTGGELMPQDWRDARRVKK